MKDKQLSARWITTPDPTTSVPSAPSSLISNRSQVIGKALDNGGGLWCLNGGDVLCDEDGLVGSRKDRSITLGKMKDGRL